MCDFVIKGGDQKLSYFERYRQCQNYAKFLKQPLELWMFVPCENGDVLEEPVKPWQDSIMGEGPHLRYKEDFEKYQKAKRRCLFEGFDEIDAKNILSCIDWRTVEELANNGVLLKLTKAAIKQIGI